MKRRTGTWQEIFCIFNLFPWVSKGGSKAGLWSFTIDDYDHGYDYMSVLFIDHDYDYDYSSL